MDQRCPNCGASPDPEPIVVERSRAAKLRELGVVLVLFGLMVFVIVRSYVSSPLAEKTPTPVVVAVVDTPTPTAVPGQLTLGSAPPKVTSDTSAAFTYSWTDPSGGTFECRLDTQDFTPCDPAGHRYDQLSQGIHTFQVRVIRPDGAPTNAVSYGWRIDRTVPELSFFPAAGDFATSEEVVIQSSKAGTIYYTTDGSDPTTASSRYQSPIPVRADVTIKAITVDDAGNSSGIASARYRFAPAFHDDFELGTLDDWSDVEGLSIDEQGGLNSKRSARAVSTDGTASYATLDLSQPVSDLYIQSAVRVNEQGNNPVALMRFRNNANDMLVTLYVTSTGRLAIQLGQNASATSGVEVDPGPWNEIELHILVADGRTTVEVWFNGRYVDNLHLTTGLVSSPVNSLQIGESADRRVFDVSYDNVTTDDTFIPSAFLVVTDAPGAKQPIEIGSPVASPSARP